MPRKDERANRAARSILRDRVAALARYEVHEHHADLIRLYQGLAAEDSRTPTVAEVLGVVEASRRRDEEAERLRWEILALARCAGATTRQIKAASGAGQATVDARFAMHPVARATGKDFATDNRGNFEHAPRRTRTSHG